MTLGQDPPPLAQRIEYAHSGTSPNRSTSVETFQKLSFPPHKCFKLPISYFPRLNLVPTLIVTVAVSMSVAIAFSEFGAVAHAFPEAGLAACAAVVGGCTTVSVIYSY